MASKTLHVLAPIDDSEPMRTHVAAWLQKHAFAFAVCAGVVCRLAAALCGLGPTNVSDAHLQMLELMQPQLPTQASGTGAADAKATFLVGLLRPLTRGAIGWLPQNLATAPEFFLAVIGVLSLIGRLGVMLAVWRLCRGYFGGRRLGHRAWLVVGLVQGGLGVALLFGLLALAETPQTSLMIALRKDPQARAVVAIGAPLNSFLLGDRQLALAQHASLDEAWLEQTLRVFEQAQKPADRFVFLAKDREKGEVMLILAGLSCSEPSAYRGGWPYVLGEALDPKRQVGSGTLLLYRCSSTDVAGLEHIFAPARPA